MLQYWEKKMVLHTINRLYDTINGYIFNFSLFVVFLQFFKAVVLAEKNNHRAENVDESID